MKNYDIKDRVIPWTNLSLNLLIYRSLNDDLNAEDKSLLMLSKADSLMKKTKTKKVKVKKKRKIIKIKKKKQKTEPE